MMRWQGTTIATGLAPLAAPTARTEEVAPMRRAISPVRGSGAGFDVPKRRPDASLERRSVHLHVDAVQRVRFTGEVARQDRFDRLSATPRVDRAIRRLIRVPAPQRRPDRAMVRPEMQHTQASAAHRQRERPDRRLDGADLDHAFEFTAGVLTAIKQGLSRRVDRHRRPRSARARAAHRAARPAAALGRRHRPVPRSAAAAQ